jgi:hypothetical protein
MHRSTNGKRTSLTPKLLQYLIMLSNTIVSHVASASCKVPVSVLSGLLNLPAETEKHKANNSGGSGRGMVGTEQSQTAMF